MRKFIFLVTLALAMSIQALAASPFTLISNTKKTVKAADLATLEKGQTTGKKGGTTLTFTESDIRLVITTGPDDDMLSFRIQGMRNPTLAVPSGATLRILFVNIDEDMKHDIRFGKLVGAIVSLPDIMETAGSDKLASKTDDGMQAQEVVIKAVEDGAHRYFCSIKGHARGGMWGNITVGIKPPANMEMPQKPKNAAKPSGSKTK